jgi:hypothetical protein
LIQKRAAWAVRLLPLLVLLVLPAAVQAQWGYTTNNGAITITAYTGSGGAVTIPDAINGLPVTSIGAGAFYWSDSLFSVTIPDSVTTIGEAAFEMCGCLTSVRIGNGVTSIGNSAFSACTHLTNVTMGTNVTLIGDQAFWNCTNLTSITIPNSVTSVGGDAFAECTNLTSVTIPNSVTNIGEYAFDGCTSLTVITVDALNPAYSSLDGVLFNQSQTTLTRYPPGKTGSDYRIPNGVSSIGNGAFQYCYGLTSVTIPGSVTNLGIGVFNFCTSLSAISVDPSNSAFSSVAGALFDQSQSTLIQYPPAKAGSDYTIPNSVTSIGDWAFASCTALTNITIPNSVTSIGDWAFASCTALTTITIPNSVTTIGDYAFNYCTGLTTIMIPNSVTTIGTEAFNYCTNLTSVTIGNRVTYIGEWAFEECHNLTSVTIGNRVTYIGECAFEFCTSLTSVCFQGNAPSLASYQYPFGYDDKATVYYLPGSTGWGQTFGGLPTVLWNPQMPTSGPSFGVRTNQFGFTITGATNLIIVVEACPDLANPVWAPVATNTLTGGASYFSDPQWTNHPARFYRLRSP